MVSGEAVEETTFKKTNQLQEIKHNNMLPNKKNSFNLISFIIQFEIGALGAERKID